MSYSYKRGSARPSKYVTERNLAVKEIYCAELLKMVNQGNVLINVDESSFDRSIRQAYSWLPKDGSFLVLNENFKGKAWLILATWSTGGWFGMVTHRNVNSFIFWLFLKMIELILLKENQSQGSMPIILLDNARTYSSNFTKKVTERLPFKVKFQTPYCPEVARSSRPSELLSPNWEVWSQMPM